MYALILILISFIIHVIKKILKKIETLFFLYLIIIVYICIKINNIKN